LLAAGATFVAGGAASVFEGVQKITNGGEIENPLVPLLVLAVSFVLESISLARALGQVRTSARRFSVRPRLLWRETTDTSVKAVAAEDSAALVGILIAALGIILSAVTRDPLWDGLSSVLIGLLLVVVAGVLAVANAELLVGRAAPLGLDSRLRAELEALPGVASVPVFVTSVTGPRRVLVAAKVNFVDGCTTDDIERVADEAERRMVALFPGVQYVFLDPTAGPGGPEQERADHADAPAPAAEGQGPPADAVRRNRQ
jgi:divalent metal cation (Fe/Co/Zn/Cd) transporter